MHTSFQRARARMVRDHLQARGISDPRILDAMRRIPREAFLPEGPGSDPEEAYQDCARPVGRGQTVSQPYMVGAMTQALELPARARVLEIGTGTGYQTAVLAAIADEVWTVERDPVLAEEAKRRLDAMGVTNVRFRVGDGTRGWDAGSPYDGILVTAGAPDVPPSLARQLAPGGRLVVPIGPRDLQHLVRVVRQDDGTPSEPESLMECRFVPLVGEEGWDGGDRKLNGD